MDIKNLGSSLEVLERSWKTMLMRVMMVFAQFPFKSWFLAFLTFLIFFFVKDDECDFYLLLCCRRLYQTLTGSGESFVLKW